MATSRDSRESSTCFSASSSACIPWVVAVSLQSLLPQPLLSDPDPSTPFYEEFWIDIGPTQPRITSPTQDRSFNQVYESPFVRQSNTFTGPRVENMNLSGGNLVVCHRWGGRQWVLHWSVFHFIFFFFYCRSLTVQQA